jgi:hypothetical protein
VLVDVVAVLVVPVTVVDMVVVLDRGATVPG